jgi:hypothetical protein
MMVMRFSLGDVWLLEGVDTSLGEDRDRSVRGPLAASLAAK